MSERDLRASRARLGGPVTGLRLRQVCFALGVLYRHHELQSVCHPECCPRTDTANVCCFWVFAANPTEPWFLLRAPTSCFCFHDEPCRAVPSLSGRVSVFSPRVRARLPIRAVGQQIGVLGQGLPSNAHGRPRLCGVPQRTSLGPSMVGKRPGENRLMSSVSAREGGGPRGQARPR